MIYQLIQLQAIGTLLFQYTSWRFGTSGSHHSDSRAGCPSPLPLSSVAHRLSQ